MKDFTEKDKEQLVKMIDEDTIRLERKYIDALTDKTIKLNAMKRYYNRRFSKDVHKALVRNFKADFDVRNVSEIADITQKTNKRQAILSNNIWVLIGFGVILALGGIAFLVSAGVSGMLLEPLMSTGLHGNIISAIQLAAFMVLAMLISGVLILFFFKAIDYYESNSKEWNELSKRRMQYAKHHADELMQDILDDKNKGDEWWSDEK